MRLRVPLEIGNVAETVSSGYGGERPQPLHCCPSLANRGSTLWQLSSGSELNDSAAGTCRTFEIKPVT